MLQSKKIHVNLKLNRLWYDGENSSDKNSTIFWEKILVIKHYLLYNVSKILTGEETIIVYLKI